MDYWRAHGNLQVMPVSLKETGDYFTFDMAGESLFCIKGRDGEIRTFYNVCQHRAHQLVSGQGQTRVVVCPYHAWTYELTGELRAGPNIKAVEGFDKSSICLTSVRTEVFLGFIFVNLDNDAKPMDEWFPNVRTELESYIPHWDTLAPLSGWKFRKTATGKYRLKTILNAITAP